MHINLGKYCVRGHWAWCVVDGIIKNDGTDLNRKVASPLITGGRYSCCHSEVMGATASPVKFMPLAQCWD